MSYCSYARNLPENNVHRLFHDKEHGRMPESDNEIFGRLILEMNQAGLSWDCVLKKYDNFRIAYHNFEVQRIANYSEKDIERILSDKGVIRHRKKIEAAIYNAKQILALQDEFGSFREWINAKKGLNLDEWVREFKKRFKFVGKESVNELLMGLNILPGAHDKECIKNI